MAAAPSDFFICKENYSLKFFLFSQMFAKFGSTLQTLNVPI